MLKTIKNIPLKDIESIPLLIKDFLNKKLEGFEMHTFSLENFESQIAKKKKNYRSSTRKNLVQVLQAQNKNATEKQKDNLEKLAFENTFTVTTGHQLNLFTGPVFFIYKILQTIKTAVFLKEKFPEHHFIPIFWLASEDHDFEEINHFNTEHYFYQIKEKSGGAVGKIEITQPTFIAEFEKEFKNSIFGTELILMLKKAYQTGQTFAQATKTMVNFLFSHYGLLLIDGDEAGLKAEMKPVFQAELFQNTLKNSTENQINELTKNYKKVQVNPREINLFYFSNTRNRIELQGDRFHIVDTEISFSKEEMNEELENFPERFSPNAVLRPAYQETILPNLAYIGGNAEIMYWLELKDYFNEIKVSFPILIPRNSMLFLASKVFQKLEKLQLSIDQFFENILAIIQGKLLKNHEILALLEKQKEILKHQFSALKNIAESTDKTFKNMVSAEENRQLKSFERLKKRLLKAERIKNSEKLERIEQLFLDIHPKKIWQERVFNFSVFYADFGKEWIEYCYEKMIVENSELIISEF